MPAMGIGLQLYTLREDMAQDMEGTLRQVAAMGYEGVEFAGYFGRPAEQLRALLDEIGLKAIGAHVGLQEIREDLEGQIKYLQTIGGQYLVCPFVVESERSTATGWKNVISEFEQAGIHVRSQGLQFGYHNHAFEFNVQVDGEFAFDAVFSSTSPDNVQVEMDVCWIQYAGHDPVSYIHKYTGRLPLLHLKDFRKGDDGMQTLELGQGIVDLPAVIHASADAGVKWLVIEQDNCTNPPLESVATSIRWLKSNYIDS